MLKSPAFLECLTESFHSPDPVQMLIVKKFVEVSMVLFKIIKKLELWGFI